MNCKVFKNEVLALKEAGKTIKEIAIELQRPESSVRRHFCDGKRTSVRENRQKKKFEIDKFKVSKGCYLCSESDPRTLQFHHVDSNEKEATISKMLSNGVGLKKIFEEINKCEVVCANCHLKIHNEL
jgi:DNA-binding NarL/FixJ family response regulator